MSAASRRCLSRVVEVKSPSEVNQHPYDYLTFQLPTISIKNIAKYTLNYQPSQSRRRAEANSVKIPTITIETIDKLRLFEFITYGIRLNK